MFQVRPAGIYTGRQELVIRPINVPLAFPVRTGQPDIPFRMRQKHTMADEDLEARLHALRDEHRDLDAAIAAMDTTSPLNQLTLQRLKKRKLLLKDQIRMLENMFLPDIIA